MIFVLHFVLHKQVKLLFRFRTILVACDMGDNGLSWFTGLSMIGTIAVYGLNIVNAFRGFDKQEGDQADTYSILHTGICIGNAAGCRDGSADICNAHTVFDPDAGDRRFFPDDHVFHVRNQCCPAAGKNKGDI